MIELLIGEAEKIPGIRGSFLGGHRACSSTECRGAFSQTGRFGGILLGFRDRGLQVEQQGQAHDAIVIAEQGYGALDVQFGDHRSERAQVLGHCVVDVSPGHLEIRGPGTVNHPAHDRCDLLDPAQHHISLGHSTT